MATAIKKFGECRKHKRPSISASGRNWIDLCDTTCNSKPFVLLSHKTHFVLHSHDKQDDYCPKGLLENLGDVPFWGFGELLKTDMTRFLLSLWMLVLSFSGRNALLTQYEYREFSANVILGQLLETTKPISLMECLVRWKQFCFYLSTILNQLEQKTFMGSWNTNTRQQIPEIILDSSTKRQDGRTEIFSAVKDIRDQSLAFLRGKLSFDKLKHCVKFCFTGKLNKFLFLQMQQIFILLNCSVHRSFWFMLLNQQKWHRNASSCETWNEDFCQR